MSSVLDQQGSTIQWLACELKKGMFSNEMAVTYRPGGILKKSVFVPRTEVLGEPGTAGKVKVQVFKSSDKTLAVFPNSLHDIVEIQESDLSE